MGVALDGEFTGDIGHVGDGVPGGDFVYVFAVGDLGDSATTAYSPFGQDSLGRDISFPVNKLWRYSNGALGDNLQYVGGLSNLDEDYVRLKDLKEGHGLKGKTTAS